MRVPENQGAEPQQDVGAPERDRKIKRGESHEGKKQAGGAVRVDPARNFAAKNESERLGAHGIEGFRKKHRLFPFPLRVKIEGNMRKGFVEKIGLLALLSCVPAHGKREAVRAVPVMMVADYWKQRGPREKLTEEQARTALLARVCAETRIAPIVRVPDSVTREEDVAKVDSASIQESMRESLNVKKEWESLPAPSRKFLRKNRGGLKEAFGEKSYLWAWTQFQLKDPVGARATLAALYTAEFERVMSLKEAPRYRHDPRPLDEAEAISRVLAPLSSAAEAEELSARMRKMKVHVSNLPQSQVKN